MPLRQGHPRIRRDIGLITGNKARDWIIAALAPARAPAAPTSASIAVTFRSGAGVIAWRLVIRVRFDPIRFTVIFDPVIIGSIFADDQLTVS
jgi:hypothetical protein